MYFHFCVRNANVVPWHTHLFKKLTESRYSSMTVPSSGYRPPPGSVVVWIKPFQQSTARIGLIRRPDFALAAGQALLHSTPSESLGAYEPAGYSYTLQHTTLGCDLNKNIWIGLTEKRAEIIFTVLRHIILTVQSYAGLRGSMFRCMGLSPR